MGLKINSESKISQERYIELKQIAYNYYEQYNLLDRNSRTSFLEALPEMDVPLETQVIRNTLLFPDTEELLMTPKGALFRALNEIAKDNDEISRQDMMTKNLEYNMQNTQALVEKGLLKVMDNISYPDNSISDREYISIKNKVLDISNQFMDLSLQEKVELILTATEKNDYRVQIQLSTLLIPNDDLLIKQLKESSVDELATYYGVPSSLIIFKKDEYDKQATSTLIAESKLPASQLTRPWYRDELDDGIINKVWDQRFYQRIEQDYINKVNVALDKTFADAKKVNK